MQLMISSYEFDDLNNSDDSNRKNFIVCIFCIYDCHTIICLLKIPIIILYNNELVSYIIADYL